MTQKYSLIRGNALAKTGKTDYHAELGLLDKGRTVKGLVVCNRWDVSDFRPVKRSSLKLILTFPGGTNRCKTLDIINIK